MPVDAGNAASVESFSKVPHIKSCRREGRFPPTSFDSVDNLSPESQPACGKSSRTPGTRYRGWLWGHLLPRSPHRAGKRLERDWKETEEERLENEKRSGEWKTRRERYETGSKRTQDPANGDRQRPGASGGAPASRWLRPKPRITPQVDQLPDRSRPQPGTQN